MGVDETSIVQLYKQSFLKAAAIVQKMGGDLEMAKDIFHDAMIIYLEKRKHGSLQIKSPEAYLLGIVKILWLKKYGREKHIQLDDFEKAITVSEELYEGEAALNI